MTLCEELFKQEQEWRKHSVYPLRDDSDRDFEFYVLVDPDDESQRPPFLKELHHLLIKGDGKFAEETHEEELRQWLGKNAPSNLITPLNWIKITIERYPYRLFLVINPDKWKVGSATPLDEEFWYQSNENSSATSKVVSGNYIESPADNRSWHRPEFLYKRICWISREQFRQIVIDYNQHVSQDNFAFPDIKAQLEKRQGEYLKLWLHLKWVQHLAVRVREVKSKWLRLYFYKLHDVATEEQNSPPYNPFTLPPCLRTPDTRQGSSEYFVLIDSLYPRMTKEKDPNGAKDPDIVLLRHANVFRLSDENKWYEYIKDLLPLYGEFLSGNLKYLSEVFRSVEQMDVESYRLFLYIIEQALLRTALVDERIQENYARLTLEQAGFIAQQRIFVTFLNSPEQYAQWQKPSHGIYATIEESDPSKMKLNFHGEDFKKIFFHDALGVDMIILHQGILDKWEQKEGGGKTIQALVLEWKDWVPFVVITSGRGVPANRPHGVKFLPFSGLEACMVGPLFEKLTLARQVFSLKSVEEV